MNLRRFEVNMNCVSCANKIEKAFKEFKDIKITINALEKMITVEANEEQYDDQFIIDLIAKIGYQAERI